MKKNSKLYLTDGTTNSGSRSISGVGMQRTNSSAGERTSGSSMCSILGPRWRCFHCVGTRYASLPFRQIVENEDVEKLGDFRRLLSHVTFSGVRNHEEADNRMGSLGLSDNWRQLQEVCGCREGEKLRGSDVGILRDEAWT